MDYEIIELIIDENDEQSGLDGIALVNNPAIEVDFQYFNKEEEDLSMSCNNHYVLSEEMVPKMIQMFSSYGNTHNDLMKDGFKIVKVKKTKQQQFADIIAEPNKDSEIEDTPTVRVRYKYVGPKDEKNRPFCSEMMKLNRVFRREDIIEMSNQTVNEVGPDGYDIFEWRGSYNCRHSWVELTYVKEGTIINSAKVTRGLITEQGVPGPDTRTTATINAGNTPPRNAFAEIGERGGVKESKKAPKSDTPNPNPKRGSDVNKPGEASDTRGVEVPQKIEESLQKKADEFNEKYKDKLGYGVTIAQLRTVYQRGVGAFQTSRSPNVKSAEQWAQARVNAFLYLVKNGRPDNAKYVQDNDLLTKKHPKAKFEYMFSDELYEFEESITDYPQFIKDNAAKALKWFQENDNPNNCLTQVGKVRMNQLAKGEPLSLNTVKRMKNFITRHTKDLLVSKSYDDGCGLLAMDAWGGVEALDWTERTIKKYEEMSNAIDEEEGYKFSIANDEERILVGPAMIPDKMMIRRDPITQSRYFVYFRKETIKALQEKYMKDKLLDSTNVEHSDNKVNDVTLVESWIVEDDTYDKQKKFGYDNPIGTWMIKIKVNNDDVWQLIKSKKLKGFSVQGYFSEKKMGFIDL